MTEIDVQVMAATDLEEAIVTAKLHGYDHLARQLSRRIPNVFAAIGAARITVREAARAAQVPSSTAAAAARGKIAGGMSSIERRDLSLYLRQRRDALDKAIELCERRTAL